MDHEWQRELDAQAQHLIGIMRAHDDTGIGANAQLDVRIRRLFDLFSCGSRNEYLPKLEGRLNAAKLAITQNNSRDFDGARKDLLGWTGKAASEFGEYLNNLDDGVALMVDRVDSFLVVLRAYSALVWSMRQDVNELVGKTLDGIAAAETDGWKVGASIVTAVAGVAGAFVGGIGGPAGSMLGAVAGAMVAGAAGVAIEAHGADSELGVIVRFVDSGEAMIHLIDGERARIERGTDAHGYAHRPDVASGSAGSANDHHCSRLSAGHLWLVRPGSRSASETKGHS